MQYKNGIMFEKEMSIHALIGQQFLSIDMSSIVY